MRRMGPREFLFIVPTLLLLGVFSLWPVIQSFTYTFFDYRLNDQQNAGLYVSERFNADLFNETDLYVSMFLQEDAENITSSPDKKKLNEVLARLDDYAAKYKDQEGVINISEADRASIQDLYQNAAAYIDHLNQKYKLVHGEDLPLLVEDIKHSIIHSNFTGLEAYAKVLKDPRVGIALWNTIFFTIFSVALELVLGLCLALVLNKTIWGQGLIRTTSLIAWAIPTAVAALMWSYLYDGGSGIVAHFFQISGIVADSRNLLLSADGAMWSTILADTWKTTPYMALLLLAGLQTIPGSMYEAASIDGAGKIQTFFRMTLPLLKPSILVALLFRTLDAFRVFDLIYVLTGGGPGGATETLSIYAYKVMFAQTNFGYGSVIVMLMFICVALIATVYVKFLGANLMERN